MLNKLKIDLLSFDCIQLHLSVHVFINVNYFMKYNSSLTNVCIYYSVHGEHMINVEQILPLGKSDGFYTFPPIIRKIASHLIWHTPYQKWLVPSKLKNYLYCVQSGIRIWVSLLIDLVQSDSRCVKTDRNNKLN